MTKKATFYLLDKPDLRSRDLLVCKIIDKAYNNKNKIYVHAQTDEEAHNINTQLWTFKDISFIPHEIFSLGQSLDQMASPVLIGCVKPPQEQSDVLLNLAYEIPLFYNEFAHIIEVVFNDAEVKKKSRQHYKYYQDNGFSVQTHKINSAS
jgi:DNA polymerase-3 subunit chi